MITLNAVTKLQLALAGAVATRELSFYCCWRDITNATYVPDFLMGLSNGTTDVDLATVAPSGKRRVIDYLRIVNRDTADAVVAIKFDVGGTETPFDTYTLEPGGRLEYQDGSGVRLFLATGALVGSSSGGGGGSATVSSVLKAEGAFGSHGGDAARTSVGSFLVPADTLGPNGALELTVAARLDAAPAGSWKIEVEFGGVVVATWQTTEEDQAETLLLQNQNDVAVQIGKTYGITGTDDFTIPTDSNQTLEVFVTLNDGGTIDSGRTISVYALVARAQVSP